jgi:hypothetical protein
LTTQNDPNAVFEDPGAFLDDPVAFLDAIIQDMFVKWKWLSAYLDTFFQENDPDTKALVRVFSVYSRMAVRFGQLFRDRQALSPNISKGLNDAIERTLAELSAEWEVELLPKEPTHPPTFNS